MEGTEENKPRIIDAIEAEFTTILYAMLLYAVISHCTP